MFEFYFNNINQLLILIIQSKDLQIEDKKTALPKNCIVDNPYV